MDFSLLLRICTPRELLILTWSQRIFFSTLRMANLKLQISVAPRTRMLSISQVFSEVHFMLLRKYLSKEVLITVIKQTSSLLQPFFSSWSLVLLLGAAHKKTIISSQCSAKENTANIGDTSERTWARNSKTCSSEWSSSILPTDLISMKLWITLGWITTLKNSKMFLNSRSLTRTKRFTFQHVNVPKTLMKPKLVRRVTMRLQSSQTDSRS